MSDELSEPEDLLPLVYDELRRLAADRLAREKPGQTLQPTALVHEAYLRLVGDQHFENRGHFFAAAAEAMRRILVEQARKKGRVKWGGGMHRADLDGQDFELRGPTYDPLFLNEALDKLGASKPTVAELVKLRFFAGLTVEQSAEVLEVSTSTADRYWTYAKAWLCRELDTDQGPQ